MNTPMTLGYAMKLAEARSCLAALANAAPYERSIEYKHLLLDLDTMHGGDCPATFPIGGSPPDLHRRLEARLEELCEIGADPRCGCEAGHCSPGASHRQVCAR